MSTCAIFKLIVNSCSFVSGSSGAEPGCYSAYTSSTDSWWSLVESASAPPCTQADIEGSLCTSLKDAYVLGENVYLTATAFPSSVMKSLEYVGYRSEGYYGLALQGGSTDWYWPTSQTFAPGCTLGCGRCAVTVSSGPRHHRLPTCSFEC
jgi:hypothetical protein